MHGRSDDENNKANDQEPRYNHPRSHAEGSELRGRRVIVGAHHAGSVICLPESTSKNLAIAKLFIGDEDCHEFWPNTFFVLSLIHI